MRRVKSECKALQQAQFKLATPHRNYVIGSRFSLSMVLVVYVFRSGNTISHVPSQAGLLLERNKGFRGQMRAVRPRIKLSGLF